MSVAVSRKYGDGVQPYSRLCCAGTLTCHQARLLYDLTNISTSEVGPTYTSRCVEAGSRPKPHSPRKVCAERSMVFSCCRRVKLGIFGYNAFRRVEPSDRDFWHQRTGFRGKHASHDRLSRRSQRYKEVCGDSLLIDDFNWL